MSKTIFISIVIFTLVSYVNSDSIDCNTLRMGQYMCPDPNYDLIDPKTQQIRGCQPNNKAKGILFLYLSHKVMI